MNHVGKETAENFYGTGERDHQLMLRYDGVSGYGVRLPEDIARRSRRGVAMGRMRGKHQRGDPSKQKALCLFRQRAFLLGGAGGIRTHGPRKANGFRVRLVMTTSILLHDEMISGDG